MPGSINIPPKKMSTEPKAVAGFDYGSVKPAVVTEAKEVATRIRVRIDGIKLSNTPEAKEAA